MKGILLLICFVLPPLDLPPSPSDVQVVETQAIAIKQLRRAGAKVTVDEQTPGSSVIEVWFSGPEKDFALISQIQNVKRVRLEDACVKDTHLEHLPRQGLESVELSLTSISDKGLDRLSRNTQLREFVLRLDLGVTDRGLKHIGRMKTLESLTVSYIPTESDAWVNELKGLSQLRHLELTHTNITDRGVKAICTLKALESLNLERTQVTDRCLEDLKKDSIAKKNQFVWH